MTAGRSQTHATRREAILIAEIADRAVEKAAELGLEVDKHDVIMAVSLVHHGDCPLDLESLRTAPDFDFAHDVFGILKHLDPKLMELTDCFLPRCARRS